MPTQPDFIYRWSGGAYCSFSVWEVLRETPKCLFLRKIRESGARYVTSEFRLHKKELDTKSEWWGVEWASDPQILIDQIYEEHKKEISRRENFNQQVVNAISVLKDALT